MAKDGVLGATGSSRVCQGIYKASPRTRNQQGKAKLTKDVQHTMLHTVIQSKSANNRTYSRMMRSIFNLAFINFLKSPLISCVECEKLMLYKIYAPCIHG